MNEKILSYRPVLLTLLLAAVISYCVSCKKTQPQQQAPAPSAPAQPQQPSLPPNTYTASFVDNGQKVSVTRVITTGSQNPMRKWIYEHGGQWESSMLQFSLTSQQYYVQVGVNLPIDSSHLSILTLNKKYIVNDSTGWDYMQPPGTLTFKMVSPTGTDKIKREYDTLFSFNRVKSISYVGNHRYDAIEEITLCDYEVAGEFKIRVLNDVTKAVRVIDSGQYFIRVGIIAK